MHLLIIIQTIQTCESILDCVSTITNILRYFQPNVPESSDDCSAKIPSLSVQSTNKTKKMKLSPFYENIHHIHGSFGLKEYFHLKEEESSDDFVSFILKTSQDRKKER